ncbi:tRNA (guanine-N(7)-)-methyltransferase non-catalytic subunit wdr4-like [Ciona intestinalis]
MSICQVSNKFCVVGLKSYILVYSKSTGSCQKLEHNFKKIENVKEAEPALDYALFSPRFNYFAALFSDKTLSVWSTISNDAIWRLVGSVDVKRRSVSIAFSEDEASVFVADKSGDLYKFPITDGKLQHVELENMEPIVGHISMMLDVAITDDLIITADRDEKIRISDREHPFLIRNFCLGHTDFVYRILVVKSRNLLISVSGDATLKVWDIEAGMERQSFEITEVSNDQDGKKSFPALLSCSKDESLIAVACVETFLSSVKILSISNKDKPVSTAYTFDVEGSDQILSLAFDSDDPSVLFILTVQQSKELAVMIYTCTASACAKVTGIYALPTINSHVASVPLSDLTDKEYPQLFKCCVAGHKYDAFYNKKKLLQKIEDSAEAKVPKLDM